jgi:hydrogenase/urease accessory protein HupE
LKGLTRFAIGVLAAMALPAGAHQLLPAYLQIRETGSHAYEVTFKVPVVGIERLPLAASLPDRCERTGPSRVVADDQGHAEVWPMRCAGGLRGDRLEVQGLEELSTDALVRIEHADGSQQVALLTASSPAVEVAAVPARLEVVQSYFVLGVEHILLGIDHLLFVLALLIICSGAWQLVKTVTAFTLAHSITLALATLGVLNVPSAPVEAVIALSIVFVAAEIVRSREGKASLTARAPWLVAFVFGLLHGLGFAGALSEVGLPSSHVPLALLFFNLGVEAGQLAFIAIVLALLALLRPVRSRLPRWVELVPAYAIGSIAMVWVIERVGIAL